MKAKSPTGLHWINLAIGLCLTGFIGLGCVSALADETKSTDSSNERPGTSGCGYTKSKFSWSQIQDFTTETLGADKTACYMKLFDAETSSNPACQQEAVPNPPGVGLCTLEGDPTKRNWRGGPCDVPNTQLDGDTEDGVKQQIKCCAHILAGMNGSQYFDPIKKGKVPNCELQ